MSAEDDDTVASRRLLLAIARTLDVSPERFFEFQGVDGYISPTTHEIEELLGLFYNISCPEKRRRCLEFVRAVASSPDESVR